MITIQVESVKELKAIFLEMFSGNTLMTVEPKAGPIKTSFAPEEKTPPAAKVEAPKAEKPKAADKVLETIKEEARKETVQSITYESLLARIKTLKASTVPDIIDKIGKWKTEGGHANLKDMDAAGLALASAFVDTLAVEANVPY